MNCKKHVKDNNNGKNIYGEERYYTLNTFLRKKFGRKVYKLALDGGMTCPNRDGTLGYGGCIFCSGGGSGEFAVSRQERGGVTAQIEQAKEKIRKKTDADLFIAYFQSYTNTYAPVEYLRSIFTEAVLHPQVAVLSIATRPDCLPPEVIALLADLNRIKPVWVELGLQTIHEKTAHYIRRGYPLSCYEEAVRNLHQAGIEVITHVILGLPGETKEDMLETVRYLSKADSESVSEIVPRIDFTAEDSPRFRYRTEGIKLQLLHVLKGTDLAAEYRKGAFSALDMDEYLDILFDCLELLPPEMVVHRITGDGPKSLLEAPLWSADKKMVLNTIRREMKLRGIFQGKNFEKNQTRKLRV
ncbi:MAG: TIGR01212 family radical SAM protein [Lachnospiraceae bacterium]|nr:TIGR01212 family radical SAM protein [Lachnospiraceae bacterium]